MRKSRRTEKRVRWAAFAVKALIVAGVMSGVEVFFASAPVYQGDAALDPRLSSPRAANGHTLVLDVVRQDTVPVDYMAAWYGGAAIRLYPHPGKPAGTHVTLIGVPYETPPRPDTVGVAWGVGDRIYHRDLPFRVVAGPYPSEEIRGVDQSRVTPGAEELARIARERELIAAAYVAARDSAMMDGPFAWPVEPRVVTSPYGTRRVFNGQLRSVHGGLDLRAREGTPIYAAQSGVVRLAQNLFYAGNHVLIEHGMGIHTSYSHLSKIEVEAGQWVEKGQRIGLAGATGRVTAAHLHWTVSVHGVGVSPLQCVEVLEGVYK